MLDANWWSIPLIDEMSIWTKNNELKKVKKKCQILNDMDSVLTLWFALRLEAMVNIKKICLEDEDVFY